MVKAHSTALDRKHSIDDELWNTYRNDACGGIIIDDLLAALQHEGLSLEDPRLAEFMRFIRSARADKKRTLDFEMWSAAVRKERALIEKALTGNFVVPDWPAFCEVIAQVAEHAEQFSHGDDSINLKKLGDFDLDAYGVSVCTVDGQIFNWGDCGRKFCLQACSKPITYAMAVEQVGLDAVHKHVGREPSGQNFNKLVLKEAAPNDEGRRQIPHNPMINAGAMMSLSFIDRGSPADTFVNIKNTVSKLCASRVSYNNEMYLIERDSASRNLCLLYMMREMGSFPRGTNPRDVLDSYFQACSIEMNTSQMAVMAATFANGGKCPLTNEKPVFSPDTVRASLSLMLSCGLNDYSGEWAFKVGLPAKSGIGGSTFLVIPNKMGICIYSPRHKGGNSVRGIAFANKLTEVYRLHLMDNLRGMPKAMKRDPFLKRHAAGDALITQLLFASSRGDLREVKRLLASGANLAEPDYDNRTALHLAAAENRVNIVRFFLSEFSAISQKQPRIDPALLAGLLPPKQQAKAATPTALASPRRPGLARQDSVTFAAGETVIASGPARSANEKTFKCGGNSFASRDAPFVSRRESFASRNGARRPEYSALSRRKRGSMAILSMQRNFDINAEDRWGGTPLDDAYRYGHQEIIDLLEAKGALRGEPKSKRQLSTAKR